MDEINYAFANCVTDSGNEMFDFDSLNDTFNSKSFRCFNEMDVFSSLNKIKSKSVGTDDIEVKFLKLAFPHISGFLLHLFNTIIMKSQFPSCWKTARVVPIPKTKVINSVNDLRPISILPVLSKVFEHMIKDQILDSFQIKLYDAQYAFRKGHNTTTLLLSMTDSIRHSINSNRLPVLLSLDISKAFNSINYCILIQKLFDQFRFSKSACKLILSYLCNRLQFVTYNGVCSSLLPLTAGVPQGSVLGPLLFILFINDLPLSIDSGLCKTYLYADDVALLFDCEYDFIDVLQSNINFCLQTIFEWAHLNLLCINHSKTKAIIFNPYNRDFAELNIFLNGVRIGFVDQLRYLGIVLDSKLSFECYIDQLHGRVWFSLRRLFSSFVFLPIQVRQKLAFSLLMSQVIYGLEVITGTLTANFVKLNRIINSIVRFVYNIKRREHVSEYVIKFLGCSFYNFVKLRCLLLFYKMRRMGAPLLLCRSFVFTRLSRNPQILIPRISYSIFERSFLVRIARYWNGLPLELRTFSHSNNAFRLKFLNYVSGL